MLNLYKSLRHVGRDANVLPKKLRVKAPIFDGVCLYLNKIDRPQKEVSQEMRMSVEVSWAVGSCKFPALV